jgi:hypothetical protein
MDASRPTVYLAGPILFGPDPDPSSRKAICVRHGLHSVSPAANQAETDPGLALSTGLPRLSAGLWPTDAAAPRRPRHLRSTRSNREKGTYRVSMT